jgi:hypothetical protein
VEKGEETAGVLWRRRPGLECSGTGHPGRPIEWGVVWNVLEPGRRIAGVLVGPRGCG